MSEFIAHGCFTHNAAVHPTLARWSDALWRWHRRWRRREPVRSAESLRTFLQTRASHVAQMTLYGYLRTRAGTRFPELFENDAFAVSLNIAKWHVWLACLSDLSVYAGGLLRRNGASAAQIRELMCRLVDEVLADAGTPADAGPEFTAHAQRVQARMALCDWSASDDGEAAFVESPTALVYWAPIVDDLKALDADIVRNSIRFRWHEVRRDLSHNLDPAAVLASTAQ